MNQINNSIQYISQGNDPDEHIKHCVSYLKAGGQWVQLRMKGYTNEVIHDTTYELIKQTTQFDYQLILNDHVLIAASIKDVGCHVGKLDMTLKQARDILGPDRILGATANTISDIRSIAEYAVDYIGLGPFAFTSTKKNLSPILGMNGYHEILQMMNAENITIPIVAIGGIQKSDIRSLLMSGVYSIAASKLLTKEIDQIKDVLELMKS